MDKVVYFLGAGFSAPLGIPVMSNFLFKSKDMFFANQTNYAHFGEVLKTIQEMNSALPYYKGDLFNIEEILSILQMQESLTGQKRCDFDSYICDVIDHHTPCSQIPTAGLPSGGRFDIVNYDSNWQFYPCFIASVCNPTLTPAIPGSPTPALCRKLTPVNAHYAIITLNYDRVIECLWSLVKYYCEGVSPSYAFPGLRTTFQKPFTLDPAYVGLAHLHGSVADRRIVPPTWSKSLSADILPAWKAAYAMLITNRFQDETNCVMFGSWQDPETSTQIWWLRPNC